jgi:hypothetical protein
MLIAAMILGLIGGITYFIGGISAVTSVAWEELIHYHTGPPWWAVSMIPVGLVATLGGYLAYRKPYAGAVLLLLASVAAMAIGIASFQISFELDDVGFVPPMLSVHPFGGSLVLLPGPILAVIIATALAFVGIDRLKMKSTI